MVKRAKKVFRHRRVKIKQVGYKNKGCGGEHTAMGEATIKGYVVSKTTETDLLGYDFVMDDGDVLYRVEVKTQDYSIKSRTSGKKFKDRVQFNLVRRNTTNKKYDYIHYFALVCPNIKKIAWIKYEDISNKSKLTIHHKEFDHLSLPTNKRLLNVEFNDVDDAQDNQMDLFIMENKW